MILRDLRARHPVWHVIIWSPVLLPMLLVFYTLDGVIRLRAWLTHTQPPDDERKYDAN